MRSIGDHDLGHPLLIEIFYRVHHMLCVPWVTRRSLPHPPDPHGSGDRCRGRGSETQILHPDPDGHETPGGLRRPHCRQLVADGIDRAGLADQGYCCQHLLQPALGICIFKDLELVGHKFLKHGFMIQLPGSRHAVGAGRPRSLCFPGVWPGDGPADPFSYPHSCQNPAF